MLTEIPGYRTGRAVVPRRMLLSDQNVLYVQTQCVLDSTNSYDGANTNYEDEIRVGTPMARITATKKWVPCKRTTVLSGGGTVTTCVLTDARAFKVGDTISINGDSVTIATINYSNNTITWTGSQTIVNGETVIANSTLAGAEICRGFLDEYTKLKSLDDGVLRDRTVSRILIAGFLDNNQILGDLAAIRAATEGSGKFLKGILWGDEQGYS